MSDAEILATAIIAAMYSGGNHSQACSYMKDQKLVPRMLEKSRFNRRLHKVSMLMNDLFH
ncbi:transposase [Nostoc sp. NIES-4103]|nr:transposase [Nostoc sp. NIES-4103]